MQYLKIKDWGSFQHYKDRSPKWIKLYRDILDNYEFGSLTDATKGHLCCLWLLASVLGNKIPADPKWIQNRIGATSKVDLNRLETLGFIEVYQDASSSVQNAGLIGDKPVPREEESREDKEKNRGEKSAYGELGKVKLTDEEYSKLLEKHGELKLSHAIEILDTYIGSKGDKYKSHFAVFKSDSWIWDRWRDKHQQVDTGEFI